MYLQLKVRFHLIFRQRFHVITPLGLVWLQELAPLLTFPKAENWLELGFKTVGYKKKRMVQ